MENKIKIESTEKLLNYKEFQIPYGYFVETGSAAGDGIQRAIDAGFRIITSIEAQPEWYAKCVSRFEHFSNPGNGILVNLILGKSTDELGKALQTIIPAPYVIFLDAHVSGEASFGYKDWIENGENSEGAQDKIIKEELAIIFKHSNMHTIIIDDVNGETDGHAQEYCKIMLEANPNYKFYFYDENLSGNPNYYYKDKILVAKVEPF